ncbi:MAG: PKD domain-containing protein [Gammaproteobacteria bacterium]
MFALLFSVLVLAASTGNVMALTLDKAKWNAGKQKLIVIGTGNRGETVSVVNANDAAKVLGSKTLTKKRWRTVSRRPAPVPCAVRVLSSNGESAGPLDVEDRPANCGPVSSPPANEAPDCVIDTPSTDITISEGATVNYAGTVTDADGNLDAVSWVFDGGTPADSALQDPGNVSYATAGIYTTTLDASDSSGAACVPQTRTITVEDAPPPPPPPPTGDLVTDAVAEQVLAGNTSYKVLAANDLGMHCADLDDQIFSILPPFNVVHAQIIQMGSEPTLVTANSHPGMSVVYSAAANPDDPVFDPAHPTLPSILNPPVAALAGTDRAAISINSTSQNDVLAGLFKGNFWEENPETGDPIGFDAYDNIFFGLLGPAAIVADTGLPVPDSVLLPGCLASPASCAFGQQLMPGIDTPYVDNAPKHFDRFDRDFNFFSSVLPAPLGSVVQDVNWWAADGIPILPIDDAGRVNAYPLMRVQAVNNATVVASTDVVLPVASEADCQNCHVDPVDCADPGLPALIRSDSCIGAATDGFELITLDDAPPGTTTEQRLLNTAKINILRLHDVEHGSNYPGGWGSGGGCDAAANPNNTALWNDNCLANSTPVQCSQCHYSPALDLAQLGPTDDPVNQVFQASVGITMSAVMHGHHGSLMRNGAPLFPDMPSPVGRSPEVTNTILEETCYQCHPGKRTQCLRGAMFSGGVVCQDCHGEMADVGHDFTTGGSRVPWASEPKCQSCHTGDALNPDHPSGALVAADGIRLLQAYTTDANAPIERPNSRFAENESLYRLSGNETTALESQGHAGIMCEGCHGSTHAIWPNANPFANDNVAAMQLQGHTGTLTECSTCHGDADLGLTQDGPHGMHQVSQISANGTAIDTAATITSWNRNHEELNDFSTCRTCHGVNGEGTVLARTAANRTLMCKEDDAPGCRKMNINGEEERRVFVARGTEISCVLCHENKINEGGGDD